MFRKEILKRIQDCFTDCVENFTHCRIARVVKEALRDGTPALDILEYGLNPALRVVGERFERGEYFVSDLIIAGQIMKEGVSVLEQMLPKKGAEICGTILIGTVKGDMHDVGKNIFSTLAQASGFRIIDLGVDVSADRFVEAVRENNPDIVGMSALLGSTMNYIPRIVEALVKAGLRNRVRIIAGGAPITQSFARRAGADAGVNNAVQGVEKCREWLESQRDSGHDH
ncbi:MAG: corrinoid protein [Candidatus Bathyarchaeota archaeon]|nr:MAG: corrinoid protein [Candidatus Bathyarchaeota archaeon]